MYKTSTNYISRVIWVAHLKPKAAKSQCGTGMVLDSLPGCACEGWPRNSRLSWETLHNFGTLHAMVWYDPHIYHIFMLLCNMIKLSLSNHQYVHCHIAVLALRLSFIHSKEAFHVIKLPSYLWNLVTSVGELGRGHRRTIQKCFEIATPLNCSFFHMSLDPYSLDLCRATDMQREATIRWITIRLQSPSTVLVSLNSNLSYICKFSCKFYFTLHGDTSTSKIHNTKAEEHEILGSRWLLIANNSPRLMEPLQISVSFPQSLVSKSFLASRCRFRWCPLDKHMITLTHFKDINEIFKFRKSSFNNSGLCFHLLQGQL